MAYPQRPLKLIRREGVEPHPTTLIASVLQRHGVSHEVATQPGGRHTIVVPLRRNAAGLNRLVNAYGGVEHSPRAPIHDKLAAVIASFGLQGSHVVRTARSGSSIRIKITPRRF